MPSNPLVNRSEVLNAQANQHRHSVRYGAPPPGLDRLARNVAFVSALMESGVEFTAVDFPKANRLTIHILAAVAEHEAAMISARTKAALAAAPARGKVLGGYRGVTFTAADHVAAAKARRARSVTRATELAPVVAELRNAGVVSLNGIAKALTQRGIPTARGGSEWQAVQVSRLLANVDQVGA